MVLVSPSSGVFFQNAKTQMVEDPQLQGVVDTDQQLPPYSRVVIVSFEGDAPAIKISRRMRGANSFTFFSVGFCVYQAS